MRTTTRSVRLLVCSLFLVGAAPLRAGGPAVPRKPGAPAASSPAPAPSPAEARRVVQLLEAAAVSEADVDFAAGETAMLRLKAAQEAERELEAALAASPALWPSVRPRLLAWPRAPERRDLKARYLGLLVGDGDPGTRAALIRELAADPAVFGERTLLRMMEGGVVEAAAVLRARVEAGAEPHLGQAWPAIALAFRGSPEGVGVLRWLTEAEGFREGNPDLWLAAQAARARLGEAGAWREGLAQVGEQVRAAVEAGRLVEARWALARAEWLAPAALERRAVSVVDFSFRLSARVEAEGGGGATSEALLGRLEALVRAARAAPVAAGRSPGR